MELIIPGTDTVKDALDKAWAAYAEAEIALAEAEAAQKEAEIAIDKAKRKESTTRKEK